MKLIENSKNYFVTSDGEIYHNDKRLNPYIAKNGYKVTWIVYLDGTRQLLYVHRLVAKAYLQNPENYSVVNHKNLNKLDNRVENLEWCTQLHNNQHAHKNGAFHKDGLHHRADYTIEQIEQACILLAQGCRNIEVEDISGVNRKIVNQIRQRETWNHISKDYVFPKRSRTVSDDTVHWICNRIVEGLTTRQITDLANNPKVNKSLVNDIKTKKNHKQISDMYF